MPRNVRLSEAPSHGLPALIYDLKCPGSEAYVRLARELIGRLAAAGGRGMSAERPAKGLGMGLQALLGEAARPRRLRRGRRRSRAAACARSRSRESGPIPNQPRVQFDEEALDELAESIRAARRAAADPASARGRRTIMIIAGERRWRAAQRARLHAIPAIVREIDESTTAEIALIENIQREDLNPLEEAEGYRQLIERHGHTQDEVGRIVHKSRSHVANLLRLLDLPEFVQAIAIARRYQHGPCARGCHAPTTRRS